jgi:hypothetical protein
VVFWYYRQDGKALLVCTAEDITSGDTADDSSFPLLLLISPVSSILIPLPCAACFLDNTGPATPLGPPRTRPRRSPRQLRQGRSRTQHVKKDSVEDEVGVVSYGRIGMTMPISVWRKGLHTGMAGLLSRHQDKIHHTRPITENPRSKELVSRCPNPNGESTIRRALEAGTTVTLPLPLV